MGIFLTPFAVDWLYSLFIYSALLNCGNLGIWKLPDHKILPSQETYCWRSLHDLGAEILLSQNTNCVSSHCGHFKRCMWGLVKATDGISLLSHIDEMQLTSEYNVRLALTLPWIYETLQFVFLNISDANGTRCKFQHFFFGVLSHLHLWSSS